MRPQKGQYRRGASQLQNEYISQVIGQEMVELWRKQKQGGICTVL
jgi:hypothetical protein